MGRRTVLETGQAAYQSLSLTLGRVGAAGKATTCLEGPQPPEGFQGSKVDLFVLNPQSPHGINPASSHGLDIGSLLGDMTVLGRVVVADDEVGDVGREVVLVDAAHVGSALGYLALHKRTSVGTPVQIMIGYTLTR